MTIYPIQEVTKGPAITTTVRYMARTIDTMITQAMGTILTKISIACTLPTISYRKHSSARLQHSKKWRILNFRLSIISKRYSNRYKN